MKYFEGIKTIWEAKERLDKLIWKLHPFNGGDGLEFVKMLNEYVWLNYDLGGSREGLDHIDVALLAVNIAHEKVGEI